MTKEKNLTKDKIKDEDIQYLLSEISEQALEFLASDLKQFSLIREQFVRDLNEQYGPASMQRNAPIPHRDSIRLQKALELLASLCDYLGIEGGRLFQPSNPWQSLSLRARTHQWAAIVIGNRSGSTAEAEQERKIKLFSDEWRQIYQEVENLLGRMEDQIRMRNRAWKKSNDATRGGGGSKGEGQEAGGGPPPDTISEFATYRDIAKHYSIKNKEALRKRLERWELSTDAKSKGNVIPKKERRKDEPKTLYRVKAIEPIITDMVQKQKRPTPSNPRPRSRKPAR